MAAINTISTKKAINHRWLIVASGIVLIALGVWIMFYPLEYYLSISVLFAILITAAGVLELIFTLRTRSDTPNWGWHLAGSAADIIMGIYLIAFPLITMVLLPVLFGLWILIKGVVSIVHSFYTPYRLRKGKDWLLMISVLMIPVAFLIILNPLIGALNFVTWTALAFILSGVFRIAFAIRLKRFSNVIMRR